MKTVTVTFPIKEAVEALRLLRAESTCLIEQTEYMPDHDIQVRINHVLSARERITTALEGVADMEDTVVDPSQMDFDIPRPYGNGRKPNDEFLGTALEMASGAPIAAKHGVVTPDKWSDMPHTNQSQWTEYEELAPDPKPVTSYREAAGRILNLKSKSTK